MTSRILSDPRFRSPVSVPSISSPRPFLIEAAVDKTWSLNGNHRRPGDEFEIKQIGGFFDEEGDQDSFQILAGNRAYQFDRKYLSRIWPGLYTPHGDPIHCSYGEDLVIRTEAKAIVVLAGVFLTQVR